MVASMYLNDKTKDYSEIWEKAQEALSLFINLSHMEGRAEANFLIGMIHKKTAKRMKMGTLKLKHQPKSEFVTNKKTDFDPRLNKTSSDLIQFKDEEKNYLNVSKRMFAEMGNDYGFARVSLAIAIRHMDSGIDAISKMKIDEVRKNLLAANQGFEKFRDYANQISCHLRLSELELNLKHYDKAKGYAETAHNICRGNNETYFLAECLSLLTRINENIRSTSMNVFVFLKAFPLVDPNDLVHIGPITQKNNNFKSNVIDHITKEKKVIQLKFDVLTRESLNTIKNHGCRVLHLSSDEHRESAL